MKKVQCLMLVLLMAVTVTTLVGCGPLEEDGTEGGACLEDDTCNAGLVCNASNVCESEQQGAFTTLYNSESFQQCAQCHAPGADGFVNGTEATQNWSSKASAHSSLQETASGLIGNFEGCNGVPFINQTPGDSLLVAVLDENVRAAFSLDGFPDCNSDTISDMTLKIGGDIDGATLSLLKEWVSDGAPND